MTQEEREERIIDLEDDLFFATKVLMETPNEAERADITEQIGKIQRELDALTGKHRHKKHK